MRFIIYMSMIFSFFGCNTKKVRYDFNTPLRSMELSNELNEISGLAFVSDSLIACVQDEKAMVYYVNTNTGKVESSFDFGKKGDFEGIAVNADTTYILRSDGRIFISVNKQKAKEYKFKNNNEFNFEGMCLDRVNDRLLIACKEHGKKKKRDYSYVYSFSIKTNKYAKEPIFKTLRNDIHPDFMSSGIAINHFGDIFIISANSKTLLVINPDGSIKTVTKLNEEIYNQPEGICFDKSGNIFISNEKTEFKASLLKIDNKQKK